MKGSSMKKIVLKDFAYIRNGESYAAKNWHEINKMINIESALVVKSSPDIALNRRLYFKFDISGLELSSIKSATLDLRLQTSGAGKIYHFDIYRVCNDWSGDTITWNNAPIGEKIYENLAAYGLKKIKITELVRSAVESGYDEFSIVVARVETIENETRIRIYDDMTKMPNITLCDSENSELCITELTDDKEKNAEYWAKAEKDYQEWIEKYNELCAKKQPDIKDIVSPDEQFSKTSLYKGQSFIPNFTEAKTRTFSDLKDIDLVTENVDVKYDKYGGMMIESLKQEATGFFFSKKIGDRWWLFDPLGYPYFIKGLDVLNYSFAKSKIQTDSMLEKYGSAAKWAEETTRHLKDDLGFSAASRPAQEMLGVNEPIPVQLFRSFMSGYGRKYGINNSNSGSTTFSENNTMPVFDPNFELYADECAQMLVDNINNPNIIGYSFDNELPMDSLMLDNYLTIDPTKEVNHYSYAAAWNWFKKTTGKENPEADDITDDLRDKFRGFIWNKYFSITTKAFRKYDPNHMMLGTRFLTVASNSEWVMKVAGSYLDAITINWYFQWTPDADALKFMSQNADKPFIVTEFYAKAGDSEGNLANRSGAGFYVETQQDRADFYHNFTLRMLECKNMVGWYWLQYIDNDPNNGIGDLSSRDSNKGIISNTHNEYTVLTSAMAQINKNIYRLISYFDKKYN